MKTNKRKEGLLGGNEERTGGKERLYLEEECLEEEIQMADFRAIDKNMRDYAKLDDQKDDSLVFHTKPNHGAQSEQQQQRIFAEKSITPISSYNFEPNQIIINGMKFVHVDSIKGQAKSQQKPKKPEMYSNCDFREVQCGQCCLLQMVPANSHSYICYNCDCQQECTPEWGIFICGHCQRKVWYALGRSETIKCGKCWTVNWIPKQEKGWGNNGAFFQKDTKREWLQEEKY